MFLCLEHIAHHLERDMTRRTQGWAGACVQEFLFSNSGGNIRLMLQPMWEPWNPWSREGEQSKHDLSRLFILCWGKGFFSHFRHAMSVLLSHDSRTCEQ